MAQQIDSLNNSTGRPFSAPPQGVVTDAEQHRAFIVSTVQTGEHPGVLVDLEGNGQQVFLPQHLLQQDEEGNYRLPFSFSSLAEPFISDVTREEVVIPVIQEELQVSKRVVDTGKGVRVRKTVVEREETIDELLHRDEVEVTRVAVGEMITGSEPPQPRTEGDTLIVPILEEVLVVQKQLRLKEEIRITRHQHEYRQPQKVTVRSERASIERFEEEPEPSRDPTLSNRPQQQ